MLPPQKSTALVHLYTILAGHILILLKQPSNQLTLLVFSLQPATTHDFDIKQSLKTANASFSQYQQIS